MIYSAWESETIDRATAALEPAEDASAGWFQQLELHRPSCLLLYDYRSRPYMAVGHKLTDPDLDDVASAQLAVDCQVEQGSVADALLLVEQDTNGPDLLWN